MTARLLLLVAGLVLFAVLHTLLAAERVRARLSPLVGPRGYRLAYNLLAITWLLGLAALTRGDWRVVWDAHGVARLALRGVQIAAGVLLAVTARSFDLGHFAGIRQLRRRAEERGGLRHSGPYRLCRHPLYLATCVLFSAQPTMDLRWLITSAWLWIYSAVGSAIEEHKLVAAFGAEYRSYQSTHRRLLPLPVRGRRGE
jgi:protein-S-isoprenylcysteine O-methyltransferase Ste14